MDADLHEMARELGDRLLPGGGAGFDPAGSWEDLGRLLSALEERGLFLMTNSVADPGVRRMAAFHKHAAKGYPCVGMSSWGAYKTIGEAVLRAAHAAIFDPRA